jgi:hypothetical protein
MGALDGALVRQQHREKLEVGDRTSMPDGS